MTLRRGLFIGIVALASGALAVALGQLIGKKTASDDIERLQMVWPRVMEFSDRDRAFLAGLSMTCRLHTKAPIRAAVVDCLYEAAKDPDVILPKGEDKAEATARLEQLLSVGVQ